MINHAVNKQFIQDMLTIVVQALTSGTSNVFGRISWTEAQA